MFVVVYQNPLTTKVMEVRGPYADEARAWSHAFDCAPQGTIGNVHRLTPTE